MGIPELFGRGEPVFSFEFFLPKAPEDIDAFLESVRELNQAFQTKTWRPFLYLKAHHEHRDIWAYYRHADFCMVTSLHDGMNLVAKEFVSVRDDEDGALILSRFAGAVHEMRGAFLVNPYDVSAVAEAIWEAITTPPAERERRLSRMRRRLESNTIFDWMDSIFAEVERHRRST